jgi:hypothetical protein
VAPNGQLDVLVVGFVLFVLKIVHTRSTNCLGAIVGGLVADDAEIGQLTADTAVASTVVCARAHRRKLDPLVTLMVGSNVGIVEVVQPIFAPTDHQPRPSHKTLAVVLP